MRFFLVLLIVSACQNQTIEKPAPNDMRVNETDVSTSEMGESDSGRDIAVQDPDMSNDIARDITSDAPRCPTAPDCPQSKPFDQDGDGCLDTCCEGCPDDFEISGYFEEPGTCFAFCSDAKCSPNEPCSNFLCNLSSGTCEAPSGFCSNNAICSKDDCANFQNYPEDTVCGCDGLTYFNECEMYCAGIAFDKRGACD